MVFFRALSRRTLVDRWDGNGSRTSRKIFPGLLLVGVIGMGMAACAASNGSDHMPDVRHALITGRERQVIHPDAPLDRSAVCELPGDIAEKIYNERYINAVTTDEDKDDQKATQAFQ